MSDLPILDAHAAFVDVGSEQMHVSVAGGQPQVFGTFTVQLHALRDWLKAQGVRSVAMEATGVYWLPLYGVLEAAGFEVCMVNGRQTRNLPGRKTDIQDCQWGATLHAHGLLRAGFVPPANIRRLQDYMRLRADHIQMAATHVQHMQQALERVNIKLHDVIASLTGVSGLAIVRAILGGERDPQRLLELCDVQIQRAKAERVRQSLLGTWTDEHLFALQQALQSWEHYQRQIAECDRRVDALLHEMNPAEPHIAPAKKGRRSQPGANAPDIPNLRAMLAQICGSQDLTQLPAHTEYDELAKLLIYMEHATTVRTFTVIFTVNLSGTSIGAGFRAVLRKLTFRDLSRSIDSRDHRRHVRRASVSVQESPQGGWHRIA